MHAESDFGFIPQFTLTGTGEQFRRLTDAAERASSLTIDCAALNVFFRAGMFLNGRTPFREIVRYHPAPVILPPSSLSRDAAMDAFIDLFRQAVRRRVPQRSILALSGGRDSRHILLELSAQHRLPDQLLTVAMPDRPAEVSIAKQIAQRLGLQHTILTPDPRDAAKDEIWKNRATGFMAFDHGWMACASRTRDATPWWDGIAGDVLSAGHFLDERNLSLFESDRLDLLAASLVDERPLAPLFWDSRHFHPDDARHEVHAELALHRQAPNPVGSFYFWNRTRVVIGSFTFGLLAPNGEPVLAPYLDLDVWRLLASLPARMLLDHTFHTETIRRAYPEFADIPYFGKDKTPIAPGFYRTQALSLLAYLARVLRPTGQDAAMLARTLRVVLNLSRPDDINSILHRSVYASQLRSLQRG